MGRACLVVVLSIVAACGDGVPKPAAVDPVSTSEAEEFARKFEAAMNPCDAGKLDALIDVETLLRRATEKADAPPAAKRGFLDGARSGANVSTMLCQGVTAAADASYSLLRVRDTGGQPRPLFRLLGDGKVNYHELELGKSRQDHKIRAVDLHIYVSGESLSDTLASLLEQSVASAKGGGNIDAAARTMRDIRDAQNRGEGREVRRLIGTLPPQLRQAKAFRLLEVMVAADLDEATYGELIAGYEKSFPDDPSLDMVSIDGYYLRKNATAALAAIDRIDRRVGGDPYNGLLRASAHLLDPTPEHLAEADKWAQVTTEAMPTHQNGWWTLATVRLTRGDHAGVVPVLDKLEQDFGVSFDRAAMASEPVWQGFLQSPEFAAWWAKRGR